MEQGTAQPCSCPMEKLLSRTPKGARTAAARLLSAQRASVRTDLGAGKLLACSRRGVSGWCQQKRSRRSAVYNRNPSGRGWGLRVQEARMPPVAPAAARSSRGAEGTHRGAAPRRSLPSVRASPTLFRQVTAALPPSPPSRPFSPATEPHSRRPPRRDPAAPAAPGASAGRRAGRSGAGTAAAPRPPPPGSGAGGEADSGEGEVALGQQGAL